MADTGSIATKNGDYILVNTVPDVCLTKVGKSWRPIPYNITHTMANSENVSPNVFAGGKEAFMHGESFITGITGDEPGRRGGIVTKTQTEVSFALDKSASVYVNGKPSVRTGDSVWMNQETPAAKKGKVGPDGQTSWLKVQAVYNDRWRTPVHESPIIISINGNYVPFTALSGGEGFNSSASSEAMAIETKDQPGTVVRQNIDPGSVQVKGLENKELEQATAQLKQSLRESFGFELQKIEKAMHPFKQDWEQYGKSSVFISAAEGCLIGAKKWFEDLESTGEFLKEISIDYFMFFAILTLSMKSGVIDKNLELIFHSDEKLEKRKEELIEVKTLLEDIDDTFEKIIDYSIKIYNHEKDIVKFIKHLHEANIDDIELFIENIIGDIDPQLAKDLMKNTDNHSVFLEFFGDSIGRDFANFIATAIDTIPPNFYFYITGAAGFYIFIEIIFGIVLGALFAPAAAGRLALIIGRLTQIGKATIAVTKVKGTALAIEAFLNILKFIEKSFESLKTIGRNLRIIRSPELKKEGQTGETLLLERDIKKIKPRNLTTKPLSDIKDSAIDPSVLRDKLSPYVRSGNTNSLSVAAGSVETNGKKHYFLSVSGKGWKGNSPDNVIIEGIEYQVIRKDSGSLPSVPNGPNGSTNYNHAEQKLMSHIQEKYSKKAANVSIGVQNTSASSPGMCSGCTITSSDFAENNPLFDITFYEGSSGVNP
jgi:hypothetical protein